MSGSDFVRLHKAMYGFDEEEEEDNNDDEEDTEDGNEVITKPEDSFQEHKFVLTNGSPDINTNLNTQFEKCHRQMGKSVNLLFDLSRNHDIYIESRCIKNDVSEDMLCSIDFFGYCHANITKSDNVAKEYPLPAPAKEGRWYVENVRSH
jgi:hypothetical protein